MGTGEKTYTTLSSAAEVLKGLGVDVRCGERERTEDELKDGWRSSGKKKRDTRGLVHTSLPQYQWGSVTAIVRLLWLIGQWDIVSNVVETLIPIEEVTLEVSHNNSSASCIIPCLTVLKMLFQGEGPSTQGIRTLRQVMRESLVKRFSKVEETKMVVLACLLDPRYKNHVFSSDATLTKAKEWLKEDISEEEQAAAEGTNEEDRRTPKRLRREQISCRSRIDDMFSSLLASHTAEPLAESCLEDELHMYFKEPVIDRRKGDPLQWWRQNEGRFKLLATQARKFLCPPPSSVPSERVFSEVSAIYEKNRSRLTGEGLALSSRSELQQVLERRKRVQTDSEEDGQSRTPLEDVLFRRQQKQLERDKQQDDKERDEAQLMEFVRVRQNLRKIHSAVQNKAANC
ncbi:hypothetical protein KUCAC02_012813 [Chaenocephalus aceratus]|uniref:Uncharacterized protein n=1 Tax=Chaenocephalus aceratus TaxID=36190 RepID=A0ACB9XDR0_CHAAC|nr:hypothetical protein KUCAC02_012813 [Chaenocephalus aceratus]